LLITHHWLAADISMNLDAEDRPMAADQRDVASDTATVPAADVNSEVVGDSMLKQRRQESEKQLVCALFFNEKL
jgi:hypothetical protein